MTNGINLSMTKSLADFSNLLEEVTKETNIRKLTVAKEITEENQWEFQTGKYVAIRNKTGILKFHKGFGLGLIVLIFQFLNRFIQKPHIKIETHRVNIP